jgi:hypothetical protein
MRPCSVRRQSRIRAKRKAKTETIGKKSKGKAESKPLSRSPLLRAVRGSLNLMLIRLPRPILLPLRLVAHRREIVLVERRAIEKVVTMDSNDKISPLLGAISLLPMPLLPPKVRLISLPSEKGMNVNEREESVVLVLNALWSAQNKGLHSPNRPRHRV